MLLLVPIVFHTYFTLPMVIMGPVHHYKETLQSLEVTIVWDASRSECSLGSGSGLNQLIVFVFAGVE